MTEVAFTRGEIEAGRRRLFTADWQFLSAASSTETLPKMRGVEIAFAGRSNVGKSSLINALTGRARARPHLATRRGARRSSTSSSRAGELVLVDMPGYGYAAAPRRRSRPGRG